MKWCYHLLGGFEPGFVDRYCCAPQTRRESAQCREGRNRAPQANDRRHRRARRCLEGLCLLCAQREPRALRKHPGTHTGHRRRDRLAAQPGCSGSVRRPLGLVRAGVCPAGAHAGVRAFLLEAAVRYRGRTVGQGDRPHAPDRRGRRRRGGRPAPLVGRAPGGRRAPGRPPGRGPQGPHRRGAPPAGGDRRRAGGDRRGAVLPRERRRRYTPDSGAPRVLGPPPHRPGRRVARLRQYPVPHPGVQAGHGPGRGQGRRPFYRLHQCRRRRGHPEAAVPGQGPPPSSTTTT